MTQEPIHRTTARVIPVNDAGEVLLLRGHDPARPDQTYWFSIGGGTEPGETPPETAVRELYEETGIRAGVDQLGDPFHSGRHGYSYDGARYVAHSTFFALALGAVELTFEGAGENEIVTGAGWFTPDDLEHVSLSNRTLPDVARRAVAHLRSRAGD